MSHNSEDSTLDYFMMSPYIISILRNIHFHIKEKKYDFPLVICGGTGTGKSMFALHIIELWYRVILKESWSEDRIKHIQSTRYKWIKNFRDLKPLDINCNDEGADGITSKEAMSKFGRDIQKLYNVFRKKLFFTIIIIPDFFDLPLYFRKRIRGCIYVSKRGQYKYYTQNGIKWLNAMNENKDFKSMDRAKPFFVGGFPDYKGILRDPYDNIANESPDKIINDLISEEESRSLNSVDINLDEAETLFKEGLKMNEISKKLGVSNTTLVKIKYKLKNNGKL